MKCNAFTLVLFFSISVTSCDMGRDQILKPESLAEHQSMYIIERDIPGARSLSQKELMAISRSSCNAIKEMDTEIQWLYSYVAIDKLYCVFIAPNAGTVREHGRRGGFPADNITRISTIINPATASN